MDETLDRSAAVFAALFAALFVELFAAAVKAGSDAFPWSSFLFFSIGEEEEEVVWNREVDERLEWPIWKLAPEGLHGGVKIVGSTLKPKLPISEEYLLGF